MSEETELSIKQKELAALKADPNPDKRKIANLESYIRFITPNPYSNEGYIPNGTNIVAESTDGTTNNNPKRQLPKIFGRTDIVYNKEDPNSREPIKIAKEEIEFLLVQEKG